MTELIIKSRQTEKSSGLTARGVYTFVVSQRATKADVAKTVKKTYSVTPLRINIINAPSQRRRVRGHWGRRPGFKKALVHLPVGQKIDL